MPLIYSLVKEEGADHVLGDRAIHDAPRRDYPRPHARPPLPSFSPRPSPSPGPGGRHELLPHLSSHHDAH